jgi:hypothetical protein
MLKMQVVATSLLLGKAAAPDQQRRRSTRQHSTNDKHSMSTDAVRTGDHVPGIGKASRKVMSSCDTNSNSMLKM